MATVSLDINLPDAVRSIELLLDEWQLRHEKNYEFSTYFDAAEIADALLGAETLAPDPSDTAGVPRHASFIREKFQRESNLVRMLFSAGFIGSVRLLPPHQSELLSLITFDFASKDARSFERAAIRLRNALNEAVNVAEPLGDLVSSARETAVESIREFALAEATRAPWSRRLASWKANGVLDLETISPDYSAIIRTPEFAALESALAQKRNDKPRNNFSDAAAVMTVAHGLDQVHSGATRQVPLLYLPPGTLGSTVAKSDVRRKLLLKIPQSDRAISVVRDWQYMVVRAMLMPAASALGAPKAMDVRELRQLRTQLRQIATTRERIPDLLLTLNIGDKEVTERIDTFFELCFFTNVWQPYSSHVAVDTPEIDTLATQEAVQTVTEALQEVRGRLEQNVAAYSRLNDIWNNVYAAARSIRERTLVSDVDYIRAFGAFRFAPPPEPQERAAALIRDIVGAVTPRLDGSGSGPASSNAIAQLIVLLEHAKGSPKNASDFGTLCIALWTLELDDYIEQAAKPFTVSSDWLSVLYAASQLRKQVKASVVDGVIERCKRALHAEHSNEERTRLAVAIAYLSFHLALQRGFEPLWIQRITHGADRPAQLVEDAVRYARQAVAWSQDSASPLHVYALNQSLYYQVTKGSGNRDELRDLANQLLCFSGSSLLWDFRYDDTIARYFYWASLTATDVDRKKAHAHSAKQHIEQAWSKAHSDREVATFRSILGNYLDELYPPVSAPTPQPPAAP